MKRAEFHQTTRHEASSDERYIVEVFDDARSNPQPVALGYALFRPRDGMCWVNVVSRGHRDESDAQAALDAFRRFVERTRRLPLSRARPS
jgi:hypothetical protein